MAYLEKTNGPLLKLVDGTMVNTREWKPYLLSIANPPDGRARVWKGNFDRWYWICNDCFHVHLCGFGRWKSFGGTTNTMANAMDMARDHIKLLHANRGRR